MLFRSLANEIAMLAEEDALSKTIFIARDGSPTIDLSPIPASDCMSYQTTRWPRPGPLVCDLIAPTLVAAYVGENLAVRPWSWIMPVLIFLTFSGYFGSALQMSKRDVSALHRKVQLRRG